MHIITILRDYLGLTQQVLAKSAGITQCDLCEIETKPPYGPIDKYCRLAEVLDVPVHAIVTNDCRQIPISFFEKHPHQPYTVASNHKRAQMGREGEELALQLEQKRLERKWPSLARLVLPYFKLRVGFRGFDILSFDENGFPFLIEVKTTANTAETDFNLTVNEYETAIRQTKLGVPYRIYRYSGWGSEALHLDVVDFAELQSGKRIEPSDYVCSMKSVEQEQSGIAYWRKEREISQAELARQMEIMPQHLCLYEKGARKCSVKTYLKVSEILEISIDDLLKTYPV